MDKIEKMRELLEEFESELRERNEKIQEWEKSDVGKMEDKISRMNWLIKDVLIPLLPKDKIEHAKGMIEQYGFENQLWDVVQELEAY